jgi:hypothetical protein
VFVCENPNIAAIAADRLGAAGARLLYHGDFDWAGLVIANFVMREFGAEPCDTACRMMGRRPR